MSNRQRSHHLQVGRVAALRTRIDLVSESLHPRKLIAIALLSDVMSCRAPSIMVEPFLN
jgi:hypothetical protein